jgi:DNA polymerase III sliding clamp (beta) subunit (PCNA family)
MNRTELVAKLELVSYALAQNNLVPVFECFCFNTKTVSCYNDALAIIAPCKTKDAFAVNGSTLLGLLKNSHADEVEFSIENKEDVSIKTGKSRFKLPYFTKNEFLFEPVDDTWDNSLPIDEAFLKGLEACLLTSSRDLAQPAWLGVSLQPKGKRMALYSCDGDGVTRHVTGTKATDVTAMLPNAFCEAVLRTCKETDCKTGTLSINADWAKADLGAYIILGRLIEISTPVDFEHEIENTLKGEPAFIPLPKGLDHALSRARVIADPESAKTSLEVGEGKLYLYTETQMGLVKDVLPCPKHAEVTADVFAAMVQRAIGLCDEIAILDGCTVYRQGETLFMVVSNMG